MRKILSCLALVAAGLYACAVAFVLFFQDVLKLTLAFGLDQLVSVYPPMDIGPIVLAVILMALFGALLIWSSGRPGIGVEVSALVVLSLLLVLEPLATIFLTLVQNQLAGDVILIANYSMVKNLLAFCKPIGLLSVLLLLIQAGISVGLKKRGGAAG